MSEEIVQQDQNSVDMNAVVELIPILYVALNLMRDGGDRFLWGRADRETLYRLSRVCRLYLDGKQKKELDQLLARLAV